MYLSTNGLFLCLGGTFCSLEDKIFTHVVVEDGFQDVPSEAMDAPHVKIVKQEVYVYEIKYIYSPKALRK